MPIFAQESFGGEDIDLPFSWKVRFFFDDLREVFIFNEERKAEFRLAQIQDIQDEITKLADNNEPISRQFEDRRIEKLQKVETTLKLIKEKQPEQAQQKSDIVRRLETVIQTLRNLGELNDIRLALQDFEKLRTNNELTNIQRETMANQIDNRINSLDSVRDNCDQRISSMDLAFEDDPYKSIQDICPILKSTPLVTAKDIIYGTGG